MEEKTTKEEQKEKESLLSITPNRNVNDLIKDIPLTSEAR